MPSIYQEKYQVTFRTKSAREEWAELSSALSPAEMSQRHMSSLQRTVFDSDPGAVFVQSAMAGETDVSDGINQTSLLEGFERRPMSPVEDMYTNEHRDNFYDTITVDGDEGFAERCNYLDRQ